MKGFPFIPKILWYSMLCCFTGSILSTSNVFATNEFLTGSARTAAMGDASVALSDGYAAHYNQAGLGFVQNYYFGLGAERKFMLSDLSLLTGAAAIPTNTGTFGLSLSYFGREIYNEKKVGLAFGRMFGNRFSAGIQLDYLNIFISEYGTRNAFTFEGGIQFKVLDELILGTHVFNPVRITLEDVYGEKIPTIIKLGFAYLPSERLIISAEVEKDIDFKPTVKAGLEYKLLDLLYIRAGIGTFPLQSSFGVGLDLKVFQVDLAASFHPVLGYTPHINIAYQRPRQKSVPEIN